MSFSVERMDLADTGSPEGLVTTILGLEPAFSIPTAIEELCFQLDILEIQELTTDGFEGGLLTQIEKTNGIILVKNGVGKQRRRFTIAHELGHFLLPSHIPAEGSEFLCSRKDMMLQTKKEQNRRAKMEVEANRFASLILMPPPFLRPLLSNKKYPTLLTVLEIHRQFHVSKEAAARAYAEYSSEFLAVVICKNGIFLHAYKNRRFPWINLKRGDPIPEVSCVHSYKNQKLPSDSEQTAAEYWINTEWGKPIPLIYEQVMLQANGFAMIQLKMLDQLDDDYDPEENMTSKERYKHQQQRWSR